MYPYLLRLPNLDVPAYSVIFGLGIAASFVVAAFLGRRDGLSVRSLSHLMLISTFSILVGGRVFYFAQFGTHSENVFAFQSGQVSYGGILLTLAVLPLACIWLRLPIGSTFDAVAVAAPIGDALGRVGCFCRGCCFGKVSHLPWAVRYATHIDINGDPIGPPTVLSHIEAGFIDDMAATSLPVHPAQLYLASVDLAIFVLVLHLWRHRRYPGRLLAVYAIFYAGARFCIEFLREEPVVAGPFTIAQVISVPLAFLAMAVLAFPHRRLSGPLRGQPVALNNHGRTRRRAKASQARFSQLSTKSQHRSTPQAS